MQIVYNLSGVFTATSSRLENAHVLNALLNCLIQADLAYLRSHAAPNLYDSRVTYGRTLEWERIPDVIMRGHGDCKSLSAWRIAELVHKRKYRLDEVRPVFRFTPRGGYGVPDFHILIQTPDGWECPSRKLGMNQHENSYFRY